MTNLVSVEAGDRAAGSCNLAKDEGLGNEEFERYYYAEDDGKCHKFVYKGEGGNDNRRVGSLIIKLEDESLGCVN